jgi:beta-lactamase regulating signal transducer with metallopeptidase domain
MTTLIAAHLWASTLFLALVLAVIAVARKRLTATARFWLALIGIAKFAVPGSILKPLITAAPRPLRIPLPQLLGGTLAGNLAPATAPVWPYVVAGIWAVVAVALILRFAMARHRLVTLAVRTALPAEAREVDALGRARRAIGVRGGIDIARAALPEAPAVLRVFRPLIVLPIRGCGDLSDGELESLLRHECAHVARHDNLIARIESFICAVFWFHPLIWIAQRITAIERERACDELVAASADERDTYLAALTKFCHAAIAPRLPGVSCMATAKLKERIDHVMNYEALKAHSPSPRRVALAAAAALVLFTIASAMIGGVANDDQPYSINLNAKRSADNLTLWGTIRDNASGKVITAPTLNFKPGTRAIASMKSDGGMEAVFEVQPGSGDRIDVDVTIRRDGAIAEKATIAIKPMDAASGAKYTGEPISLSLTDADLRDVLHTFGKITGLEMKIDDDVQGKITVQFKDVPWDKALDIILSQNGCTYRLDGKTMHISRSRT